MADLKNIRVASPCDARWDQMKGDERVRFCKHCQLKVFNISELPTSDALRLIQDNDGRRLCIRYYQRSDGTVMTKDCPMGWDKVRRKSVKGFVFVVAVSLACLAFPFTREGTRTRVEELKDRVRYSSFLTPVFNHFDPPVFAGAMVAPYP